MHAQEMSRLRRALEEERRLREGLERTVARAGAMGDEADLVEVLDLFMPRGKKGNGTAAEGADGERRREGLRKRLLEAREKKRIGEEQSKMIYHCKKMRHFACYDFD